jgi:hypothetical protein
VFAAGPLRRGASRTIRVKCIGSGAGHKRKMSRTFSRSMRWSNHGATRAKFERSTESDGIVGWWTGRPASLARETPADPVRGQTAADSPQSHTEHARLMLDTIVLAFQSDTTRICTFTFGNEFDNENFSFLDGVSGSSEPRRTSCNPGLPYTPAIAGAAFGVFNSTLSKDVGLGAQRQVQFSLQLNF